MDYYGGRHGGHQGDTKSLDYSSREEPSQVLVSSSIHALGVHPKAEGPMYFI